MAGITNKLQTQEPMQGRRKGPAKSSAEYKVLVTSYIGGEMVPPGRIIPYDGVPGKNLKPANAAAEAIVKKANEIRKAKYGQDGDDAAERYRLRQEALRAYDDELQGVVAKDAEYSSFDEPLSDAERKPLLAAAEQTEKDKVKNFKDDPDVHGVKMSGEQTNTMRASTDQQADDPSKPDSAKKK